MFQRLRAVDSIAILRRQTTLYGPARHGMAHTHSYSYGLCTKAVRNRNGAGEEFTAGLSAAASRLLLKATNPHGTVATARQSRRTGGTPSALVVAAFFSCVSIRLLLTTGARLPRSTATSIMGRNRFSFESSLADRLRQMERH